jgi:hypothetical protein
MHLFGSLIISLAIFPGLQAQNLVPNPSFEIFDKCPTDYNIKYKKTMLPGWYMATGGTPDYFNSCTRIQVGVPQNFMGSCFAKDGQAYAGLILLLEPSLNSDSKPTDYREYLETRLTEPLIKDQWYRVTFYFSVAPYSTYAINRLGAYFSGKRIGNRRTTRILDFKPQISLDSTKILTEKQAWFALTDSFKAKGNERYMTIGNFYNDKETNYTTLDMTGISTLQQERITENKLAYYYIDLVSVVKTNRRAVK